MPQRFPTCLAEAGRNPYFSSRLPVFAMLTNVFRRLLLLAGIGLLSSPGAGAQHLSMGQVLEIFKAPHETRTRILQANEFHPDDTGGGNNCLRFFREQPDLNSQGYLEVATYCPGDKQSFSYGTYSPDHATDLKFQLERRHSFVDSGTVVSPGGLLKNRWRKGALLVETYQTKTKQQEDLWVFQVYEKPLPVSKPILTKNTQEPGRGSDLDPVRSGPADFKGHYHALLIGVNEYTDPSIDDLRFPVQDVGGLRAVLTSRYTFEASRVTALLNPTRRAIVRALDELRQRVKPDDNVLIFFAGHGRNNTAKTQGYWLPADAENAYSDGWLSNSTVKDQLQDFACRHVLVISDACFSGGILQARSGGDGSPTRSIVQLYQDPSRKAMTSSNDTPVPDNSPFLRYLLDLLTKNEAAYLTSLDLFAGLRKAVTINSSTKQIPQYGAIPETGDRGGDFIFIRRPEK